MDTIFGFLYEFLGQFFWSLWSIILGIFTGIGGAFDFPAYLKIIDNYTTELGGLAWVVAIIAIICLAAVLFLCIFLIVMSLKKLFRFRKKVKDTNDLVDEIGRASCRERV